MYRVRVRYGDAGRHRRVHDARYLDYMGAATTEFLRALGWDYQGLLELGCEPCLKKAVLDVHRPAAFDEELIIGVVVERVDTATFTLAFEIQAGDEQVVSGEAVYVNAVTAESLRPLPEPVRERLLASSRRSA